MTLRIYLLLVLLPHCLNAYSINYNHKDSHDQLVAFYKTLRAFEQPPLKNGAPDYTQATFTSRMPEAQQTCATKGNYPLPKFLLTHSSVMVFSAASGRLNTKPQISSSFFNEP